MCRRTIAVVPLAVLACLASGCGTLINQSEPGTFFNWKGDTIAYRPYGGAQNSAKAAVGLAGYAVGLKTEGVRDGYDPYAAATISAALLVIDLPLCLVVDTILLPSDVRNTLLGRGKLPDGGSPLLRSPMPDEGWTPRKDSAQASEPAKGNALAELKEGKFSNWSGSFVTVHQAPSPELSAAPTEPPAR